MKISYAICVCNEHTELNALLSFLTDVIDNEDEINILVDSGKVTDEVRAVLKKFDKRIVINERKFCGNFSKHRNYHITKCKGDYIFVLDADEIPQEALIKNIKTFDGDILALPRINIIPGYTEEWCKKMKFSVNEMGWINWPDYQGRFLRTMVKSHGVWDFMRDSLVQTKLHSFKQILNLLSGILNQFKNKINKILSTRT
jgi:glycosyltransferase involved in cell wall biosynthesis